MRRPRVKLPDLARPGEIITIKTLINHEMESGRRRGLDGRLVPRRILSRFTCLFNGQRIFWCDLQAAISANPYLEFHARVDRSGIFTFIWTGSDGEDTVAQAAIQVSP